MTPDEFLHLLRAALPPGFEVTDYLKAGGQGSVFRGRADGTESVLKVFDPGSDPRRIEREIDFLRKVECPHVVRIHKHCGISIAGQPCPLIAYEYLPGGDLRQLMGRGVDLSTQQTVASLGLQIGTALEELWKHRIVHRDVKPDNIVQRGPSDFVLVDVGFAMHLDRSGITIAGGVPGTNGYKSPEQAMGRKNLTIHSDVFALGVTLYEIAARRHPYGNQHSIGVLSPVPLSKFNKSLPDGLCKLVMKMLSVRPSDRPSNPSEQFRQFV